MVKESIVRSSAGLKGICKTLSPDDLILLTESNRKVHPDAWKGKMLDTQASNVKVKNDVIKKLSLTNTPLVIQQTKRSVATRVSQTTVDNIKRVCKYLASEYAQYGLDSLDICSRLNCVDIGVRNTLIQYVNTKNNEGIQEIMQQLKDCQDDDDDEVDEKPNDSK